MSRNKVKVRIERFKNAGPGKMYDKMLHYTDHEIWDIAKIKFECHVLYELEGFNYTVEVSLTKLNGTFLCNKYLVVTNDLF